MNLSFACSYESYQHLTFPIPTSSSIVVYYLLHTPKYHLHKRHRIPYATGGLNHCRLRGLLTRRL
jgi:hypothetical protein